MRTATLPLLLSISALAFSVFSCARPKQAAVEARMQSIGVSGDKNERPSDAKAGPSARPSLPRVALDGGEELLGLFDLNVDQDQGDEQIAAFRRQGDPNAAIHVAVLDQDPQREAWERVWTGSTLCSAWPTFSIAVLDLLGNFGTDLVCSGMNGSGRQTMTAFHLDPGTPPAGYRHILSIEGDSIEIREEGRGEAYAAGLAPAEPLTIQSFDRDASSADFLDQTQSTWKWAASSSFYEKAESGPLSRGRIERKAIEQYLGKGVDALSSFLDGTWYMTGPGGTKSSRLLQFDRRGRSITFSEPGKTRSLTNYDWASSQETSLGLFIVANNAAVDKVRLFMEVELTGADSFSLRTRENMEHLKVESDSSWNGSYRRLGMEEGAETPAPVQTSLPELSGSWSGPEGLLLSFTGKSYSWRDARSVEEGVFGLYPIASERVLVLKALSPSGLMLGSRSYRVDPVRKEGSGAVEGRFLILRPAIVTVDGLELLDGAPLALEAVPNAGESSAPPL